MTGLFQFFSSDWTHSLGWTLLHSLWEIALVAGSVAMLLAVLQRRSANARYVVATIGLLAMVVLPVLTYCVVSARFNPTMVGPFAQPDVVLSALPPSGNADAIPRRTEQILPVSDDGPDVEAVASVPSVPVEGMVVAIPSKQPRLPETSTRLLGQLTRSLSPWPPWFVMAWLLGVCSLSVWNLGGWIAAQRLRQVGTTAAGEPLTHRLTELARRMRMSRPVQIVQSCLVDVPIVVGWLRPVILMPVGILTGFSPAQLDAILAHELAHIRRHDYLVNLFQTLVETLLFYHPGIWWISWRIRIEREHCCDDAAVAVCGSNVDYAEALTLLEATRAVPELAMASVGNKRDGTTLSRVRRVLGLPSESLCRCNFLAGSLAMLALIFVLVRCMVWAGDPEAPDVVAKAGKYTVRAIDENEHRRGDADFNGGLVSPPVTVQREINKKAAVPASELPKPFLPDDNLIIPNERVGPKENSPATGTRVVVGPNAMASLTDNPRKRFLAIEHVARLPEAEQAKELRRLYTELAPRYMNPLVTGILSSYPRHILNRADTKHYDGNSERWARQLEDAAKDLSPEEVADNLDIGLWLNIAAQARAMQVFRRHEKVVTAMIAAGLATRDKAQVERAAATVSTLGLHAFTDELLALLLANGAASEAAHDALLLMRVPDIAEPLLEHVAEDPSSLARCAGLLQGPFYGKAADPLLLKLLESPGKELRYHAVRAVYECRDPKLAPFVAEFAGDEEVRFRVATAYMTKNLPDESFQAVREQLLPLLHDKDESVRYEALRSFSLKRDLAAGPVIIEALRREQLAEGFRLDVMQALNTLTDKTFRYDRHNWGPGSQGNREAIAEVEKWLKDAVARDGLAADLVEKLTGVVTDEEGRPLEGVTIKMCGAEWFDEGRWHRNRRLACYFPRPTVSAKAGRFTVLFRKGLFELPFDEKTTRVNLWFDRDGFAPTYLPGMSPRPHDVKVVMKRGIRVSGTVKRLANGKLVPAPGVVVSLQCSSGDLAQQKQFFDDPLSTMKDTLEGCDLPYRKRVSTDVEGRYTVRLSPPPDDKKWCLFCSGQTIMLDMKQGQPTRGPDFVVEDEVGDGKGQKVASTEVVEPDPKDATLQTPWGEAVDGLQCRLHIEKTALIAGQWPVLLVDVKNGGKRELTLGEAPDSWELECDGTWYEAGVWFSGTIKFLELTPSRTHRGFPLHLEKRWKWHAKGGKKPLTFGAGKHVLRVALHPAPKQRGPWTRVLSNPVEIEVVEPDPKDATPNAPSGEAVERGNDTVELKLARGENAITSATVREGQSAAEILNALGHPDYVDDDPWFSYKASPEGSYVLLFEEQVSKPDAKPDLASVTLWGVRGPGTDTGEGVFLLPHRLRGKPCGGFIALRVGLGPKSKKVATVALGMSSSDVLRLFRPARDLSAKEGYVLFPSIDDGKFLLVFSARDNDKSDDSASDSLSEVIYRPGGHEKPIYLLPFKKRGQAIPAEHKALLDDNRSRGNDNGAGAAAIGATSGADAPEHHGQISGVVVDRREAPVAGAAVVLCRQATGVPFSKEARQTVAEVVLGGSQPTDLAYALTDEQGRFSFAKIPVGEYRLVAQSWPDADSIEGLMAVHGEVLRLHGIVEHVEVTAESSPEAVIRPLGDGVLRMDEDMPNDWTVLVLSTAAPRADPVLGFVGWGGPFMHNVIGGTRMPAGKTTVHGLPEGKVYIALFANDNNPGFGAKQVDIQAGKITDTYVPIVAGWSNGHREPPKRLVPLVEEVRSLMLEKDMSVPRLLEAHGIRLKAGGILPSQQQISQHLSDEIKLPTGRKTTLADFVAAVRYVELQQSAEAGSIGKE